MVDQCLTEIETTILNAWRTSAIAGLLEFCARALHTGEAALPAGTNGKVFFSYSRASASAGELRNHLESCGLPLWVDEVELKPGEHLPTEIATAVRGCVGIILCISPSTAAWQGREAGYAGRFRRPVRSVFLDGATSEDAVSEWKSYAGGTWEPSSIDAKGWHSLRASGIVWWIQRLLVPDGARSALQTVHDATVNALVDESPPTKDVDLVGFARTAPSVRVATVAMQRVAWELLVSGSSESWTAQTDIAALAPPRRAEVILDVMISQASRPWRERYGSLRTACLLAGATSQEVLRTFCMAKRGEAL